MSILSNAVAVRCVYCSSSGVSLQLLRLQNMKIIGCYKSELGDYWLFYNPKFEFSDLSDGAGKSFAPRLKVKGKVKLSDGWSDVPEGGDPSFRFFTVEVELQ